MHHPKNKAERRRINKKKKDVYAHDREGHVQARLAQEAEETKEALRELGVYRSLNKPEDAS